MAKVSIQDKQKHDVEIIGEEFVSMLVSSDVISRDDALFLKEFWENCTDLAQKYIIKTASDDLASRTEKKLAELDKEKEKEKEKDMQFKHVRVMLKAKIAELLSGLYLDMEVSHKDRAQSISLAAKEIKVGIAKWSMLSQDEKAKYFMDEVLRESPAESRQEVRDTVRKMFGEGEAMLEKLAKLQRIVEKVLDYAEKMEEKDVKQWRKKLRLLAIQLLVKMERKHVFSTASMKSLLASAAIGVIAGGALVWTGIPLAIGVLAGFIASAGSIIVWNKWATKKSNVVAKPESEATVSTEKKSEVSANDDLDQTKTKTFTMGFDAKRNAPSASDDAMYVEEKKQQRSKQTQRQ